MKGVRGFMSIKKLVAGGAASAVLTVSMAATAFAATAFMNGSFETGTAPGGFTTLSTGDNTSIPGWTVSSGTVDYIGNYWQSANGSRDLDMSGDSPGAVSQTFSTIVGHTYTVTFDMAGNPDGAPVVKTLNVDAGDSPTSYTFDTTGHSRVAMGWTSKTFTFTATGSTTPLTFTSAGPNNTFYGAALDNIVVKDTLTNKDQCKNDGWKAYSDPSFRNQGDCVSYIQSNPHAIGNRKDN